MCTFFPYSYSSLLWTWRRCNLWPYRALSKNVSQIELQVIHCVDCGYHEDVISDFKTDPGVRSILHAGGLISTVLCQEAPSDIFFWHFHFYTDYDTKSDYTVLVKFLAATYTSNWWFLTFKHFLWKDLSWWGSFVLGCKQQCWKSQIWKGYNSQKY